MTDKERTAREPLMTCRKRKHDVKTAGAHCRGISFGEACLRTERHPAPSPASNLGGLNLLEAVLRNVGTWSTDANGEIQVAEPQG